MTLENEQFNIFDLQNKKQFVQLIKGFKAALVGLTNGDIKWENTSVSLEVYDFLMNLGVIQTVDETELIEKILGNEYKSFIALINHVLSNNIDISDTFINKFILSERKKKVESYIADVNSPTIVDFFCGAGGMSLGFHQEGFKILLANDIENVCTETYYFNHPELPKNKVIAGDIKEIIEDVEKHISDDVDVMLGGPPCQGFSMANRQRIIDDPRNILYKYYVKGVEKLKPKFFVMENVKGMLGVAEQVREDFHKLQDVDYEVAFSVFNAKDFGVPQNRERLIYIGIRKDIAEDKNITPLELITNLNDILKNEVKFNLMDAISDLRPLEALQIKNATELDTQLSGRKIEKNTTENCSEYVKKISSSNNTKFILNHKARFNNERDIEIFGRMLPGDKSDSERIKDIMPYASRNDVFKDKYFKLIPNKVCKTITAHMKFDCNMYIHPTQARGLTPREAARVQSYPDNYFFLGPYTKTYMQIGNSVPPLMSRLIAKQIKLFL